MGEPLRRCAVLVSITLFAVGCSGADDTTSSAASTGTDAPSATAADDTTDTTLTTPEPPGEQRLTSDLCGAFDSEQPPDDFAELVPVGYSRAAQLLLDLSASFETDESMPSDLIDRLVEPTISAEFAAFAKAVERDCGSSEAGEAIGAYADMTRIAAVPAVDDYCRELEVALSPDTDEVRSASALEVAIARAPAEHAEALATLQALMSADDGQIPDGIDVTRTFATTAGLGLYAEARCGVADGFATMLFAVAFLSLAGGPDGSGGSAATGLGVVPPPADPAAAIAAVPATAELTFETIELDLEDDGDYLVSAVAPAGWERADAMFGAVFEAPEQFGFFTEFTVDTGCDGMCEATDWDARLNGTDGFITRYREGGEMLLDRPTEGTPGVVMTKPAVSDGIEGRVIRWDDAADRYFVCDFQLDGDDIALVDAFVAACEAARPGWISWD